MTPTDPTDRQDQDSYRDRPPNSEVDNTDQVPAIVQEWEQKYGDEDVEGKAGTSDPTRRFREQVPSEEEKEQIEAERRRRLDPDNRPENAEVDNTDRDFDPERGEYVDG